MTRLQAPLRARPPTARVALFSVAIHGIGVWSLAIGSPDGPMAQSAYSPPGPLEIEIEYLPPAREPWTVDREPSSVDREPSSVDRQPSTVSRRPSAVDRQPSTVDREPSTVDRRPEGPAPPPAAAGLAIPAPTAIARAVVGTGRRSSAPPPPGTTGSRHNRGSAGHDVIDEFQRKQDGTAELDRPGFTARIATDGSLSFEDKPSISAGLRAPCAECGEKLRNWAANPREAEPLTIGDLLPIAPKLELTDLVMRAVGDDPYIADKLRIADATRPARFAKAQRHRDENMRRVLRGLPEELAELWQRPDFSPAEKRRLLFERWDECADTRDGRFARATILQFVRDRDIRYSAEELVELNRRRRSSTAFRP